MTRRFFVPLILVLATAAVACSTDESSQRADPATTDAAPTTPAPETTAPDTTLSAADAATAYTETGPYPVGVTTLQLAKGPKVEVWYPAVPGTTGSETYDLRDYVPEAVKALLTADVPAGATYAAGRDAAVADGQFPVVLFSHGFSGVRVQSTFLTAHMAGWGMIVVAPEHPSRDLESVLGGSLAGGTVNPNDSVDDLLQSLDLIIAQGADTSSPFHGHVDADHVAAVGHSAGGGTVLGAAADDRIDGYVSLASGVLRGRDTGSTTTTAPVQMPGKPSLFVAGSIDAVVPADTVSRPAYEGAPSPSTLWVITGAGHNAFDDFCTFGNGTGIIGIAEASGLGQLLDAVPSLRRLGEDGCKPPAVSVDTTFPIIRHVVIAWVRQLFGIDVAGVGIGRDVAGEYGTPVEITTK